MKGADPAAHALGRVEILGVRVDDVTLAEAVHIISDYVKAGGPHLVVTTNTEFVVRAQRDLEFRQILNAADLAVPDGHGLIWAAPFLGGRLREHVAGTDLIESLAGLCAIRGHRLFLLGAAPGVADQAAERLVGRNPSLVISGTYSGSPRQADDQIVRQAIASAGPSDIILVAYGAPAQEMWLARNLPTLGIPVGIGIGGGLDFIAGRVKRAPRWMRRLGLEWLYRLLVQPWRWRRQLALPWFVVLVFREALTRRLRR